MDVYAKDRDLAWNTPGRAIVTLKRFDHKKMDKDNPVGNMNVNDGDLLFSYLCLGGCYAFFLGEA